MMESSQIDFNKWADFWRNEVGVNVIPAIARQKTTRTQWKNDSRGNWGKEPIPQKIHNEWKKTGAFNQGMAVICGRAWFVEKVYPIWFNMIDLDNQLGIQEFCKRKDGTQGNLDDQAKETIVEQHNNKNKAHVYFYSDEPFDKVDLVTNSKTQYDANLLPAIEVKSHGERLSFCTPGPHKDNSQIRFLNCNTVCTVLAEKMNKKIANILAKYNLLNTASNKSSSSSILDVVRNDQKIIAGQNRNGSILRWVDSLRKLIPNMPRNWYAYNAAYFNSCHTTEPLSQENVQKLVEQGIKWIDKHDKIESDEKFQKYDKDGPDGNEDPSTVADWLARFYIQQFKIIEKSELSKKLRDWKTKFDLKFETKKIINQVFDDKTVFREIQDIALEYGTNHILITFDQDQLIETACWILGRYHIKRIDLTGELIYFNETHYDTGSTEEFICRCARDCLIKSTHANLKEICSYIRDRAPIITQQDIEDSIHLKCLENGTFDIKTGKFSELFSPDYIILNKIPHNFDENANFPECDRIASQILPDSNSKQTFYDFLSTCLHPYTGIDFQLGGLGPPGTGKSQLCNLAEKVFGKENVSYAKIHYLAGDPTTQIDIAYKMLNIDADLSSEDIKNIDLMKKWISQESFTIRGIYSHSQSFRPTSRLLFMANDLYEIPNENDAEAIYERTQIIKIEQKFRGTDKEIKDVFAPVATPSELDGLITYLLKNATLLYQNQKIHHLMKPVDVKSHWNLFGNWIKQFVEKRTVEMLNGKVEARELFDAWEEYAIQRNAPRKTRNAFYSHFEEITGLQKTKTRESLAQIWVYPGIRLLSKEEITAIEQSSLEDHT